MKYVLSFYDLFQFLPSCCTVTVSAVKRIGKVLSFNSFPVAARYDVAADLADKVVFLSIPSQLLPGRNSTVGVDNSEAASFNSFPVAAGSARSMRSCAPRWSACSPSNSFPVAAKPREYATIPCLR